MEIGLRTFTWMVWILLPSDQEYFAEPSHSAPSGQYQILDPIAHACVERVQNKGVRDSKIIPTADPHISASRPFVLRSHQIISFVTHVGKLIGHMNE